jgi:Sulfotransferase domain
MTIAHAIPIIKRTVPTWLFYLAAIPFFLVIVPLNWLMIKAGKPDLFMRRSGRSQGKPKKLRKVFADYVPGKHDVFVSTFSKSGTNWMMQIAHQVAFRGRGEFAHIHDAVSWPDLGGRQARMSIALRSDVIQNLSPTGLRVIKTHLAAGYVPYSAEATYLVVIRDPKELFVSSYHFIGSVAGPLMPTLDVWLDLFLTKDFPMNFGNTWAEHTASYWANWRT